ncbi:MAG TPA: D-aminoacyl-tRNA deacylase [Acidimicrobiia bacterium]|nr:D-aminoacyl-tRNA deacylase [Acidimicrobiia bacterium]
MRIVLQRVSEAAVTVEGELVGAIGPGFLVLVGIEPTDDVVDVGVAADKIIGLRLFADQAGLMNRSILDTGGEALIVSQFTLLADVRRGRRPSFTGAASPDTAAPLVEELARRLGESGISTQTGRFGAKMAVALVNEGPVTLVLEIRGGRVL